MDVEDMLLQVAELQGVFLLGERLIEQSIVDQLFVSEDQKDKEELKSMIITAASNDNYRLTIHLLRQGYQVDVLNDKNQTLTHLAYYNKTHSILQRSEGLVFSNCKNYNNFVDCNGLSHLHIACATGYVDVVKKFLDNGGDIHARLTVDCNGDRKGFTSLHFAVAHHQIEVIKLLLERGADINAADSSGMTPLHVICAVSWDFRKFTDKESLTASTCWIDEMFILKLLLERNCDLNSRDESGNTPMFSIFNNDYYDYSSLTVEEIAILQISIKEEIANILRKRQLMKCEVLLNFDVDITVKNNIDESILHRVIEDLTSKRSSIMPLNKCVLDKNYSNLIRLLLKANQKLDVNAKNAKGETPISLAVSLASHEIVKVLLDHNADLSSIKIDGHHLFRHPNVILDMDMMNSLKSTISVLQSKGFKLTLGENLTIMRFLAHDVVDCDCALVDQPFALILIVSQFFYYGSSVHLKRVVTKACERLDDASRTKLFSSIQLFVEYSKLISYPIHVDEKVLETLQKDVDINWITEHLQLCKDDASFMKSTMLIGDLSVYDFVTICPRFANILRYRKSDHEQVQVLNPFYDSSRPFDKMVIIGHLAKLTLRMRIESSAMKDYVSFVLPSLPDLCQKMILEYLDIEDILRLCEAALLE